MASASHHWMRDADVGLDFLDACPFRHPFARGFVSEPYRPPVIHDPKSPNQFVIMARPRTGSNLLTRLLDDNKIVLCSGEALHNKNVYAWPPLNWTLDERDEHRHQFLDLLFSAQTQPMPHPSDSLAPTQFKHVLATGFKVFTDQLFRPEFQGIAYSPSIRKIVLRRKNLVSVAICDVLIATTPVHKPFPHSICLQVDMYVSERKAQAVGRYTRADTSRIVLTVDPGHMLRFFRAVEADNACIDAARRLSTARFGGADWYSVDYDELVNPDMVNRVIHGALKYILPLSVEAPQPHITMGSKQDTSRRNESISNFAEIHNVLRKTPRYLAMLMQGT
jgi:hypothetical protein